MNEPMMNGILAVVRWLAADRLGLPMDPLAGGPM
jgi:hypothetical protein